MQARKNGKTKNPRHEARAPRVRAGRNRSECGCTSIIQSMDRLCIHTPIGSCRRPYGRRPRAYWSLSSVTSVVLSVVLRVACHRKSCRLILFSKTPATICANLRNLRIKADEKVRGSQGAFLPGKVRLPSWKQKFDRMFETPGPRMLVVVRPFIDYMEQLVARIRTLPA